MHARAWSRSVLVPPMAFHVAQHVQHAVLLLWESHGRCPKIRTNHEAFDARWNRGESRHRHDTRRFTQVSAPLCLEVKTYSCFFLLSGTDSSNRRVSGT